MAGETWEGWSRKLLRGLGSPATKENLACLYAIISHEATSITWNPLAITGAGTPSNSAGVGGFPDESSGLIATVNFLNTPGQQDYPGRIVRPLQGGNGLQALHGFEATGAWSGDFPGAYDSYRLYVNSDQMAVAYGASPLLADPGHGQGDIGSVKGGITDVLGVPNPLSGLEAIGHFFAILGEGKTWVRIGYVLGGAILLFIGVSLARNDIYPRLQSAKGFVKTIKEVGAIAG